MKQKRTCPICNKKIDGDFLTLYNIHGDCFRSTHNFKPIEVLDEPKPKANKITIEKERTPIVRFTQNPEDLIVYF